MANHVSSSAHDHPTHVKLDSSDKVIRGVTYTIVTIFCIFCILPFWLIVASSFSSEAAIRLTGFTLWPTDVSTYSYELLFRAPEQMLGAYAVTIGMTVVGTLVGLFVVSMTGYALQRKDFPFRNAIMFYIYFTSLFSAGLVPFYLLMVQTLGLRDTYWAVLLPLMMSPWVIVLMKNFVKAIPHEITESGKIDGAGDFRIFYALILPSMKPALATIGLFLALGYWNEWYYSSLFLTKDMPKPLQYHLYNVINKVASLKNSVAGSNIVLDTDLPSETLKMATAVVATGPIILLYPFVQKYFVAGLTVGSVKG
ncbi:MAG TPA: carbohydrate ABC transporter permease [Candidatus Fimadaptatus faecigallinarum]|uniref:Carbohydrate ABC transporter permease n=1 Tax=Candidatus Fimadaptatus faecigallinarum TaxID=2840814 RepID=A0A9D1LPK6_9FIRM|nr:carbohydrate ABC transporter permease [Candidatus Fimadaptatus faecigallinarum]